MEKSIKEVEELKSVCENLLIISTELRARIETVTSMHLDIYKETHSDSEYKNTYSRYVNTLEKEIGKGLDRVSDFVYNQSVLIRFRFDLFEEISEMKENEDYLGK